MAPSAVQAEPLCSERIRQTWRLRAVDDDLRDVFGRVVLIAGRDLRNIGMELKHVGVGRLDLNHRQFDVLRRTREDTPPFVFQFTAPPQHPWCFPVFPLRADALEATRGHPYVTLSELQAEAFTFTLVAGRNFPFTQVEPPRRFKLLNRPNVFSKPCRYCFDVVPEHQGVLGRSDDGDWIVLHQHCRRTMVSELRIDFARGEPARYLAQFSEDRVPDEVWPDVVLPRDYREPEIRPAYVMQAARLLESMRVFEHAPERVVERPELRLVAQRLDAVDIARRMLARARGEPDEAEVVEAVERLERQVVHRILRTPYFDQRALELRQEQFERLTARRLPGPFGGSDRLWIPASEADDLDDPTRWDWPGIREVEAKARQRVAQEGRCTECGQALTAGQPGSAHLTCLRPVMLQAPAERDWTDWRAAMEAGDRFVLDPFRCPRCGAEVSGGRFYGLCRRCRESLTD